MLRRSHPRNFELTAGLRYTKETKDLDATVKSSNRACTLNFVANVQRTAALGFVPPASVPTIIGLVCLPFFNPFHDGVYIGSRKETEWSGTGKLAGTKAMRPAFQPPAWHRRVCRPADCRGQQQRLFEGSGRVAF